MKKLLILQGELPLYRKPVFNGLTRDYQVTVLHSGEPTVESEDAYREILVPCRKLWLFMVQNNVFREISSGNYDAIIAMFDLHWPAYILPVFKQRKGKFIFWGHGYSGKPLVNKVRDWLMKKADAVLLYGPEETNKMIQRGVPKEKIFVAQNTVHVPNHRDYSSHVKNNLLFVGRLQKRKKIDMMIEAFSRIHQKIPRNIRLEIVGDGEEKETLEKKVRELDLEEKVKFYGQLYQHDLLEAIFSRAYAYLSPGDVGLGVLHSFAYGVPVITRKPVIPGKNSKERHGPEFLNLMNGINSMIFANEGELEKAMRNICNDRQFAANLGYNAYQLYSKERTLEMMLNGFKKAIES